VLLTAEIESAIATVDDPEFPGVSIVDLGLLESIDIAGSEVLVGLVPTFYGCPALDVIREDVAAAVMAMPGVTNVDVKFLAAPRWTPARISDAAKDKLATEFTVAVQVSPRKVACPRCAGATTEVAAFGPTRCRSVSRCVECGEIVEVVR
jgi:ring-1,2-phenylacetyl-CoA epoxidase subunit PaaD